MQNEINYYYGIYPKLIYKTNDHFEFKYKTDMFYMYKITNNIIDKLYINDILKQNGLNLFEFILNNKNKIISNIANDDYCLLKLLIPKNNDKSIDLNDICLLASISINYNKSSNKWCFLWENKLDGIENSKLDLEQNDIDIYNTIDYFIGYGELALNYIKNNIKYNELTNLYLSHFRVGNIDYIDFYNPFNMIIDSRIRDISEYIKYLFINGKKYIYTLDNFLNNILLDYNEYILLTSRLIFPTFYFDYIESNNKQELKKIIVSLNDYSKYIRNCMTLINSKIEIPKIDCLEQ